MKNWGYTYIEYANTFQLCKKDENKMPIFIVLIVLPFPIALLLFGCGYLLALILPLNPIQGTFLFTATAILLATSFNFFSKVLLHQSIKEDFSDFDKEAYILESKPVKENTKKKRTTGGRRKRGQTSP